MLLGLCLFGSLFGAARAGAGSLRGVDETSLDASVDPCVDFYQYACGVWMKNHPIPSDRGSWGRGSELEERNLAVLRGILEKAAAPDPGRSGEERLVGDFYASCMDEPAIEARGLDPLRPELQRIAAVQSRKALIAEIARLHSQGVNLPLGREYTGTSLLFRFGSEQDAKDATSVIAVVDQGGLGLPDRDYYLKDDAKSGETRDRYRDHLARVFVMLGDSQEGAAAAAKRVLGLETELARVSLEKVKRRDPLNIYHKMTRNDLGAIAPALEWKDYFADVGAPRTPSLNVAVPDFIKGVNALLGTVSLDDWKDYLRWNLARSSAPFLGSGLAEAGFEFYGKTLGGAREISPRWKRCASLTDVLLGEALGRLYVAKTFGGEGKERTLKMVAALEKALRRDIETLPWMTDVTKKRALAKLEAIRNKIGYPDAWRDYRSVRIARDDLAGNVTRARSFEVARRLAKIGRPIDRGEWLMTPPTVNAYYDAQMNDINFPAGILQPPFYDNGAEDPVNFGGIGSVIGHELTHGFDDQGRKFDPRGDLSDWWTAQDAAEFEKRATCIADEYAGFVAVGDVKLNGRLTLGENTADNGGLRIAYMALQDTLAGGPPSASGAPASAAGAPPSAAGGLTPQQRFFVANARIWCANYTDEAARLRAQTNEHSLPKYRVNGVVSNMPEFREAFACPAASPMVRESACRVW